MATITARVARSNDHQSVASYLAILLLVLPITPDSARFYFGNGLLVMGLVVALALYGFFTSLAGRPLLGQGWVGER